MVKGLVESHINLVEALEDVRTDAAAEPLRLLQELLQPLILGIAQQKQTTREAGYR